MGAEEREQGRWRQKTRVWYGKMRKERASPPPCFPTVYRQQEFPVINKSTVGSAAVRSSASDPDGFYSLTSDITH